VGGSSRCLGAVILDRLLHRAHVLNIKGRSYRLPYERGLADGGTGQLAGKARWVSEEVGDWAGHDIASFAPVGLPRRIEVKTTNGWERPPFHMTPNELAVDEERRSERCLFRL
jgi:hypothetical protein